MTETKLEQAVRTAREYREQHDPKRQRTLGEAAGRLAGARAEAARAASEDLESLETDPTYNAAFEQGYQAGLKLYGRRNGEARAFRATLELAQEQGRKEAAADLERERAEHPERFDSQGNRLSLGWNGVPR